MSFGQYKERIEDIYGMNSFIRAIQHKVFSRVVHRSSSVCMDCVLSIFFWRVSAR